MIDRDALETATIKAMTRDRKLSLGRDITIAEYDEVHQYARSAMESIWPQIEKLQDDLYNLADKLDEANERADALEERLSECQETCGGLLVRR